MNKVVFVQAFFAPLMREKTVKVPTGEKKKALFGLIEVNDTIKRRQMEQVGTSDRIVDAPRLAEDLAAAIERLNNENYEVVTITPVISAHYDYKTCIESGGTENKGYGGYGYGYGYSFTDSLIVTAKKIPA